MSIQIEDSGSTIKVTDNGVSFDIPKPFYLRYTQDITQPGGIVDPGRIIIQYPDGTESREWNCAWTSITLPVETSVEDMYDAISVFNNTGGGGSGTNVNIISPLGQRADAASVSVVLSSGTETMASVLATTSGSVAAGKKGVAFTTSSDFIGSINGVARAASINLYLAPDPGKTLAAIPYIISAGGITIDSLT